MTDNTTEKSDKVALPEGDGAATDVDQLSNRSGDSDKEKTVNAEVLLFGEKLEKSPLGGSIELSSGEDSTEGEEETSIGIL